MNGAKRASVLRDDRGAVAMEAAFVMPVYIYFTIFLFQLSMFFFWQQVLDHATAIAARTIQVGSSSTQATSSATFVSNILCPNLNGLIPCSQVQVNVTPVSDFYSTAVYTPPRKKDGTLDTSALTYCNGAPNELMLVHALYASPINLWPLTSGQTIIISTAAFETEDYTASGSPGC